MISIRRTLRWLAFLCFLLTAYTTFSFYNFQGNVTRLVKQNPGRSVLPESQTKLKESQNGNQRKSIPSKTFAQAKLLEPDLLHVKVHRTVKNMYLRSIDSKLYKHDEERKQILANLESDLQVTENHPTASLWHHASTLVKPNREITPNSMPQLGNIINALSSERVLFADVARKGTQLKLYLKLEGDQGVLFKPKFYARSHVIEDGPYAGADRHNGEIAAFHLSRLLDINRVPIAAGRLLNIKEILKVASDDLRKTFFDKGNETCFYGKCFYCNRDNAVCTSTGEVEGAVVMMLPKKHILETHRSPWQRTYRKGAFAKWETDPQYCKQVRFLPEFSGRKILDLIDNSIFDFLIGNADRHHVETFQGVRDSMVVLLDNGKSFGNPNEDEFSILAPLYQCCLVRNSTYNRLAKLVDNIGDSLDKLTKFDVLYPLLTAEHLGALDRRLRLILATFVYCQKQSLLQLAPA